MWQTRQEFLTMETPMRNHPEPGDYVIDSRDIIERIEELQAEHDNLSETVEETRTALQDLLDEEASDEAIDYAHDNIDEAEAALAGWQDDNGDELQQLLDLQAECEGYSDWRHGETLIHTSYWVEYVEEMLKDCGTLPQDIPHYIVIDWEATADNVAWDYAKVDFGDETYYIRN